MHLSPSLGLYPQGILPLGVPHMTTNNPAATVQMHASATQQQVTVVGEQILEVLQ